MKKTALFLAVVLALFTISGNVKANVTTDVTNQQTTISDEVEQPASFPGGIEALYNYLAKNIQYPEQAVKAKTSGVVYVSFDIEEDGTIINVAVIRGIGNGCDEEAVRVVKSMPKWNPATKNDKKVASNCVLPIRFQLDQ